MSSVYFDSLPQADKWYRATLAGKEDHLDLFRRATESLDSYEIHDQLPGDRLRQPKASPANRSRSNSTRSPYPYGPPLSRTTLSAPTSPRILPTTNTSNANASDAPDSRRFFLRYLAPALFDANGRSDSGSRSAPADAIEPHLGDILHRPKLMVCHDFKNGYLQGQDDSALGYYRQSSGRRYLFQYPQLLDSFVYFSHHRVSVPPVSWINMCHRNCAKCFGTIIFEGSASTELDSLLSRSPKDGHFKYVPIFAELVRHFGFDGFLLNIEAQFSNSTIATSLIPFILALRAHLQAISPRYEVIWYDSYIYPYNKTYYCNGVNEFNDNLFGAADSLLTNYWWTSKNLQENIKNVGILGVRRKLFVGYDVWGRGSNVGKGGFDSSLACQMIAKYQSNVALFAPAWTYEQLGARNFVRNDTRFWIGLFDGEFSVMSSIRPHNVPVYKINDSSFIFYTNFCSGQGQCFSCKGVLVSNKPWVDGNLQWYLPLTVHRDQTLSLQLSLDRSESFHAGSCLEVKYVPYLEDASSGQNYRIFSDQQVRCVTLYSINKECHLNTIGVKLSYKLNENPEEIFKLRVKYKVIRRSMKSPPQVSKKGYLVCPLGPTYGKWFTLDNAFNIDTTTTESIVVDSIEICYDKDNMGQTNNSSYNSYVMEDSVVTSVIDNEQYEKLTNSIYDDDDQEGWIVVPKIKSKPVSGDSPNTSTSSSSSTLSVNNAKGPVLRLGELAIVNSNNYPSPNFFGITPVTAVDRTFIGTDGILYKWSDEFDGSTLYYVVYINDEFHGTSQISQFFDQYEQFPEDSEDSMDSSTSTVGKSNGVSARETTAYAAKTKAAGYGTGVFGASAKAPTITKVRIDTVDRFGAVYQGSDIFLI